MFIIIWISQFLISFTSQFNYQEKYYNKKININNYYIKLNKIISCSDGVNNGLKAQLG